MNVPQQVEILLVEDNAHDAELTLRALKARNRTNQVFVARDGVDFEAFARGVSEVGLPWVLLNEPPR